MTNHWEKTQLPVPRTLYKSSELSNSLVLPSMASAGRKQTIVRSNPSWSVPDFTHEQFERKPRPSRPEIRGTFGEEIRVLTNYFVVNQFPKQGLVYQYHIDIENQSKSRIHRQHRRMLYELWKRQYCQRTKSQLHTSTVVFDNYSIVLTYDEQLPEIDEKIIAPNPQNRREEYRLTIKRVGEPVDLQQLWAMKDDDEDSNKPMEEHLTAKQVLSIALHENCSSHAHYIYYRCFFAAPRPPNGYDAWDLGRGTAAWRGFFSCLFFGQEKYRLLINLDVKHGVFFKQQPFIEFLREVMKESPGGKRTEDPVSLLDSKMNKDFYQRERDFLLKQCKDLRVQSCAATQRIVYTIQGFGLPASEQQFQWNTHPHSQLITVQEYFRQHHGIELKYPSLPTLKTSREEFIPMETVDVEPAKIRRISEEQLAKLCQHSSLKPFQYQKAINDIRGNPQQQCFESDPFVRAWQLNVDVKMLDLVARVLPPPQPKYTRQYRAKVSESGTWNANSTQFFQPTPFPKIWALINLSSIWGKEDCRLFSEKWIDMAYRRGIQCPMPVIYEEIPSTADLNQIIGFLRNMMGKNDDCRFILFILPEEQQRRNLIYGTLKELCELELGLGIVTQMVRATKLRSAESHQWYDSAFNNILLKVNTKLNGINSTLDVHPQIQQFFRRAERIMYVGIDLSHIQSDTGEKYSTVAVVASADEIPNRYFKEIYVQKRPAELRGKSWETIVNLKEIMKSLILQYNELHGAPPRAIIIYRDGISTSEFTSIFEQELTNIREACVELSPIYRPALTYIVANKRHHTRFFLPNSNQNAPAGTVFDSRDITNPNTFNFYLASHQAQKGTTRSTHYHILYDDNQLTADQIHTLTNALCYACARCTRAISIPAPVKYADLLAYRARFYIKSNTLIQSTTADDNTIKSERIVLSSKLDKDAPFFV